MSACRYTLHRNVVPVLPKSPRILLWIMLSPSTADDTHDDATIRRLKGFTKSFGFDALMVGNLYGRRATRPLDLRNLLDPVGPHNDSALTAMLLCADAVVCAWGQPGPDPERYLQVLELVSNRHMLRCLGVNANGHPKHPLRLRADTRLEPYYPDRAAFATCAQPGYRP